MFQYYSNIVPIMFQYCFNNVLVLFQSCSDRVLVPFQSCLDHVLIEFLFRSNRFQNVYKLVLSCTVQNNNSYNISNHFCFICNIVGVCKDNNRDYAVIIWDKDNGSLVYEKFFAEFGDELFAIRTLPNGNILSLLKKSSAV